MTHPASAPTAAAQGWELLLHSNIHCKNIPLSRGERCGEAASGDPTCCGAQGRAAALPHSAACRKIKSSMQKAAESGTTSSGWCCLGWKGEIRVILVRQGLGTLLSIPRETQLLTKRKLEKHSCFSFCWPLQPGSLLGAGLCRAGAAASHIPWKIPGPACRAAAPCCSWMGSQGALPAASLSPSLCQLQMLSQLEPRDVELFAHRAVGGSAFTLCLLELLFPFQGFRFGYFFLFFPQCFPCFQCYCTVKDQIS